MPGRNLRLLSLDGGGVRGLSSLELLGQLMERIDPDSPPKPCEYFDMIGGTSTGGLIAIMLGRLEMSVEECKEAYRDLSESVFQQTQHRLTLRGRVQGRFSSKQLELAIKKILRDREMDENTLLKNDLDSNCKVFVCATSSATRSTVHLTSFSTPRGSPYLKTTKIWEAGRATSAATSFFDPIVFSDPPVEFIDGATGANNPVKEILILASDLWGCPAKENLKCLVSIGTGKPSTKAFGTTLPQIAQTLVDLSTDTERTASLFAKENPDLLAKNMYFRFNVDGGLDNIGLEKTEAMGTIAQMTRDYIQEQSVYMQLGCCAERLKLSDDGAEESEENNLITHIFCCPYAQNDTFVGREDILFKLDKHLKGGQAKDKQSRVGLYAIELAFRSRSEHHVFLCNGSTKEDLENTYLSIGRAAAILLDSMKEEQCIPVVIEWLDSKESGSWRLVIENFDEFDPGVEELLPKRRGAILFTSRDYNSLDGVVTIPNLIFKAVIMQPTDAGQMLIELTGLSANSHQEEGSGVDEDQAQFLDAKALAEELECLPLAIAQAAGYLRKSQHISLEGYTKMLKSFTSDQSSGDEKLTEHFKRIYKDTGQPSGPPRSIMTTWNVSLLKIVEEIPKAGILLQALSILAYDGVPHVMLKPRFLKKLGLVDDDLISDALGLLHSYSMISVTRKGSTPQSYNMHRLVSLWTRTNIEDKHAISAAALEMVDDAFPLSTVGTTQQGTETLRHARALIRYCTENKISTARHGISLSYKIGRHLYFTGAYSEAKTWLETSLRYFEDNTKAELELEALDCRYYLGLVLSSQSNLTGAREHFDKVYETRKQTLGEDDPKTIDVYIETARITRLQGKNKDSRDMLLRSLDLRKGNANSDSFDSQEYLPIVEGLGSVHQLLGEYKEASKWFTHDLYGAIERYGPHSVVSFNMTLDLMETLRAAGDDEEASTVFEKFTYQFQESFPEEAQKSKSSICSKRSTSELLEVAFPVACRLWGATSIRALDYMDYMALTMAAEGRTKEALELHQKVFDLSENHHGLNHMTTLDIAFNLAAMLCENRRYEEAINYLKMVQRGSLSLFQGQMHPITIGAMERTAWVHLELGCYNEAKEIIDKLFDTLNIDTLNIDTLDIDSLDNETLAAFETKGFIYREVGEFAESIKFHRVALNGFTDRCGPESLSALMTSLNLAATLIEYSKATEAFPLIEQVGKAASHEEELSKVGVEAQCLMARVLSKTGKSREALELINKLLSERQDSTPEADLEFSNMMHIKGECLDSLQQWNEALQWYEKALSLRKQCLGSYHPDTLTSALAKTFALSLSTNVDKVSEVSSIFRLAHERLGKCRSAIQPGQYIGATS